MSESENVSSLLQSAGLGLELRAALEAGSAHDPSPGELAGLGKKLAALLPPGTLPPAPAPAPASPSPPADPAAPPAAGLSSAAKIAGAIAVLGAIGGAAWLARAPAVVGASVVVVSEAPPAPSSVASAAPSVPALSASAAPVASVVVAPRPSTNSVTTASAEPAEPEALMIKRAHDALLQGSADRALAVVTEHARAYPKGALAQEREVIAIEALVARGRQADARARADAFRAAYPSSAHLARIERLVGAP